MAAVLIFVVVFLICLWAYHRWNHRRIFEFAKKVPSHKLQMIFGLGPILTPKTITQKLIENCQKLGHNFIHYVGPYPQFVTGDPETVQDILTSRLVLNKGKVMYMGLDHGLGNGLLSMPATQWKHHRKLMDAGFKFSKLLEFVSVFNKKIKRLFAEMDGCDIMEDSYNILVYCREFTLSTTAETMLGRDLDKSADIRSKDYAEHMASIMEYISDITFNVLYQSKEILNLADLTIFKKERKILDFFRKEVDSTYRYNSNELPHDPQYLENFDCNVAKYVNENIQNNVLDKDLAVTSMMHLFGAGFETTSSTIYFIILMLAMHPEYQAKAYAEICDLLPDKNDDGEFEMTYEHITQLSYLDMFVKETMRLFPTVPLIARTIVGGDFKLSNGVVIPDKLDVFLNIYNLHRNKDVWGPDADKFNPDNFLPSKAEKRHPYAFIPFAKGLRFCIGMRYAEMSIRVAAAKLIKRYKFSTTAKVEDLVFENRVSLQLASFPPLTIERRRQGPE
ncbi:probable cytochrome P450 313a4 [Musca autumnalis]|uniref:probable cytochrome P450 313a4 n=1 Tax=Musca autumnalis TaxID=221902 RepID=UPI003CEF0CCB